VTLLVTQLPYSWSSYDYEDSPAYSGECLLLDLPYARRSSLDASLITVQVSLLYIGTSCLQSIAMTSWLENCINSLVVVLRVFTLSFVHNLRILIDMTCYYVHFQSPLYHCSGLVSHIEALLTWAKSSHMHTLRSTHKTALQHFLKSHNQRLDIWLVIPRHKSRPWDTQALWSDRLLLYQL